MLRPEGETSIMHILIYTAYFSLCIYTGTVSGFQVLEFSHMSGLFNVIFFEFLFQEHSDVIWEPWPGSMWKKSQWEESCAVPLPARWLGHQSNKQHLRVVCLRGCFSCASLIMSLSLWTPARFRCLGGDQDYRVFLELWDQLCVGSVSCHTYCNRLKHWPSQLLATLMGVHFSSHEVQVRRDFWQPLDLTIEHLNYQFKMNLLKNIGCILGILWSKNEDLDMTFLWSVLIVPVLRVRTLWFP